MPRNHLYLLRGLPGAGKTELASSLNEGGWPCFSVDDYFTDPASGKYRFEFDKNHLAYKTCESNCRKAMQDGAKKIFVHNTFTLDWELEIYLKLAAEFNYQVHVMTVENYHGHKNVHQVPNEQIKKMADKYRVKLY